MTYPISGAFRNAYVTDIIGHDMSNMAINSFSVPPMTEVESFVFKSSTFREFCGYVYESSIVLAAIRDIEAAFAKMAADVQYTLHPDMARQSIRS